MTVSVTPAMFRFTSAVWRWAALAALLLSSVPSQGAVTTCPEANTLEELTLCLIDSDHMPRRETNGFVIPSESVQADWLQVTTEMLDASQGGSCEEIVLPTSLAGLYELVSFTDTSNEAEFCVLVEMAEVGDPDKKAWGTFVTSLNPQRELAIHIPHPLNEAQTAVQGTSVFKTTRARSFLLTGSHRNSNDNASPCQSNYKEADAAHNVENLYHAAAEASLDWYEAQGLAEDWVAIQFHGMATTTCPGIDVYMTYGRSSGNGTPTAGDDLLTLQSELEAHHPDWSVVVPGDAQTCGLNGTTNTQGRLLNNVASDLVCNRAASGYTGRFIHIEQKRPVRDPSDWIDSMEATWPVGCAADEHFELGLAGWFNDAISTCTTGAFVTATPTGEASAAGVITQVEGDHTSGSGRALFTATNTGNGTDDVDGGVCILRSPSYPVEVDSLASIWYFHGQSDTGDDPEGDYFRLEISTDGGATYFPLASVGDVATDAEWTRVTSYVAAGSTVQFRLEVADGPSEGNLMEAGIDDLLICPSTVQPVSLFHPLGWVALASAFGASALLYYGGSRRRFSGPISSGQ